MAASRHNNQDRFVPSVGFVIGGFALASAGLGWTEAVAVGPVESVPGLVAGALILLAFGARRYGMMDHRLSVVAGFGAGSLTWAAMVAFLYPFATSRAGISVGPGIPVAFVLGLLGLGVAYADYLGIGQQGFLSRAQSATRALAIGLVGLLVGFVVAGLAVSAVPTGSTVLQQGVSTGGFSVGLGIVALGFLVVTDRDRSYIDVAWPSRRDWLYVVGGVVAMYGALYGLTLVVDGLGLPSTQHSLIDTAQDQPTLLLWFIPLSWLAIGPGEELLSRNIIQKYLYDSYSRPAAIVVATIVFTLIHLPAYGTGSAAAIATTLIRLFAISLVLGIVYERTESVVVAALVHGTYDAIQFALAFAALSGGYI